MVCDLRNPSLTQGHNPFSYFSSKHFKVLFLFTFHGHVFCMCLCLCT